MLNNPQRITIFIEKEMNNLISIKAKRRGLSKSQLIRKILLKELEEWNKMNQ